MKKLFLLILLLGITCHPLSVVAQKNRPPNQAVRKQADPASEPRVEISYDKFKDKTNISLYPMKIPLASPWDSHVSLELLLVASYPGNAPKPIDNVLIEFKSRSDESQFRYSRNLIALVDGERDPFGSMKYDFGTEDRFLTESLTMLVDARTILELADAKHVEMQLGNVEFALGENHMKGLREFAKQLRSSEARWKAGVSSAETPPTAREALYALLQVQNWVNKFGDLGLKARANSEQDAPTTTGVNYRQYRSLVIEVKARTDAASRSLPDGPLKTELNAAIDAYTDAGKVWEGANIGGSSAEWWNTGPGKTLISKYSIEGMITFEYVLKLIWSDADRHINNAARLLKL